MMMIIVVVIRITKGFILYNVKIPPLWFLGTELSLCSASNHSLSLVKLISGIISSRCDHTNLLYMQLFVRSPTLNWVHELPSECDAFENVNTMTDRAAQKKERKSAPD